MLETVGQGAAAGRTIAHFEIVEEIGRGGMGVVYRATDKQLGRTVALKMLPDDLVSNAHRRRRFVREARLAAAISHPNVATVYEIGETDDSVYIALEYIEGSSLRELFKDEALATERVLEIASDIARALAVAHEAGVLHRDLKPGNVMINQRGEVKLLDFGLAKSLQPSDSGTEDTDLATQESAILGTPAYMSPEQCRGGKLDARSDVFSFGTMLYEMLAGQRPFAGDSAPELGVAIMRDEPESLSALNSDLPPAVIAIVERCLQKRPTDRYADGGELAAALNQRAEQSRSGTTDVTRTTAPVVPSAVSSAEPRSSAHWPFYLGAVALALVAVWWLSGQRADTQPLEHVTKKAELPIRSLQFRALTHVRAPRFYDFLAFSRDGSRVAYDGWPSFKVRLHDLSTDTTRVVPVPAGVRRFEPLDFFPDPNMLLVRFSAPDGEQAIGALNLRTNKLRLIHRVGHTANARVSPDGSQIVFTGGGLFVVSAAGGKARRLRRGVSGDAAWSPDGKRIAFARPTTEGKPALEIITLDHGDTQVVPTGGTLMQRNIEIVIEWAGDRILFVRDGPRSGANIWQVDAAGGSWDQQPPRLVRTIKDTQLKALRYGGRRFAMLKVRLSANVRIADLRRQRVPLDATQRLSNHDGHDTTWAWLTDGRALFTSDRDGPTYVFVKTLGGKARKLVGTGGDEHAPKAFGSTVLFHRVVKRARTPLCRFFRVEQGGVPQKFLEIDGQATDRDDACPAIFCAHNKPHRCIIGEFDGPGMLFRSVDPRTGKRGPVRHRTGRGGNNFIALSPDGTHIGWAQQSRKDPAIVVVELKTGNVTKRSTPQRFVPHDVSWRVDDSGWLVTGYYSDTRTHALVTITKAGKLIEHVVTDLMAHNPVSSPDGRYAAFNMSRSEKNVWLLEPNDL